MHGPSYIDMLLSCMNYDVPRPLLTKSIIRSSLKTFLIIIAKNFSHTNLSCLVVECKLRASNETNRYLALKMIWTDFFTFWDMFASKLSFSKCFSTFQIRFCVKSNTAHSLCPSTITLFALLSNSCWAIAGKRHLQSSSFVNNFVKMRNLSRFPRQLLC